jgi:hypothetical protein
MNILTKFGNGSNEKFYATEYQQGYVPQDLKHKAEKNNAKSASKFCIIVEDFEDRRIGLSTHQQDFLKCSIDHNAARSDAASRKLTNNKTSFILGNEDTKHESVSKTDYFKFTNGMSVPEHIHNIRSENWLKMHESPMPTQSTNHEDYKHRSDFKDATIESAATSYRNKVDFQSNHFDFGRDWTAEELQEAYGTVSKRDFEDKSGLKDTRIPAGTRKEDAKESPPQKTKMYVLK